MSSYDEAKMDAMSDFVSENSGEIISEALNEYENKIHELMRGFMERAESEAELVILQNIDAEITKLEYI